MTSKDHLSFLPENFRHEKYYLHKKNLNNFQELSRLEDSELNEIVRSSPLCTIKNLRKIRAVASFNCEINISPHQAYILLHSGISSVKSLSLLNPHEIKQKIERLERFIGTKSKTNITLSSLKDWIKRAKQIY